MRILGFRPSTSPPQIVLSSTPPTTSLRPVSDHSLCAKPESSIWNRSFTLTASPFFGTPGVVTSGSDRKKDTYLAQRVDVQMPGIVRIWFGKSVSRVRESAGSSGLKAGQSGGGCCCFAVVDFGACFACFASLDLGAISGMGQQDIWIKNSSWC
jgi:hypothetical protein